MLRHRPLELPKKRVSHSFFGNDDRFDTRRNDDFVPIVHESVSYREIISLTLCFSGIWEIITIIPGLS